MRLDDVVKASAELELSREKTERWAGKATDQTIAIEISRYDIAGAMKNGI
ncbi:MAG TPA: hypothetical protein VGE98_11520 [Thermoanaerobaculia bacterium]